MSTGTRTEIPDPAVPERTEEPLRPLTVLDWLVAFGCGLLLAALSALAAMSSAPSVMVLPLALAGFGLGLLAYLDHVTHLILDTHTLVFAGAAGAALFIPASAGYVIWGPAAAAAALAFLFMLGVTLTGFTGGGDLKLAPVPAAILTAAASPLAAIMWLLLTFLACVIYQTAAKITANTNRFVAMVPFMALALVPALILSSAIMTSMGLE